MEENRRSLMAIAVLAVLILYSAVLHGGWILLLTLANCAAAVLTEYLFLRRRMQRPSYDALITGMLYTLVLPPFTPLDASLIGIVFGVFFGKCVYGGSGFSVFNPALVGRIFLHASFTKPMSFAWLDPNTGGIGISDLPMAWIGAVLLVLGGLFLMYKKFTSPYVAGSLLVTYGLLTAAGYGLSTLEMMSPIESILSGGILLGALFMAVDPVTSPRHRRGQVIYGIIIGTVAFVIRTFSDTQGAIVFAILMGNMLTPIINIAVDSYGTSHAQSGGEVHD